MFEFYQQRVPKQIFKNFHQFKFHVHMCKCTKQFILILGFNCRATFENVLTIYLILLQYLITTLVPERRMKKKSVLSFSERHPEDPLTALPVQVVQLRSKRSGKFLKLSD